MFARERKFDTPWEAKVPTAFFRGTATGGGVTVETNQRLHIAHISYEWSQQQQQQPTEDPPHLDAKIVGWNLRDKKIASSKMTCVTKADFKGTLGENLQDNFVEIYKQSSYKYLVYVEGHCAACRYGFMMQLGSTILKVESRCVADQMWYFPLLRPYHDHVPVKVPPRPSLPHTQLHRCSSVCLSVCLHDLRRGRPTCLTCGRR